MLQNMTMLLEY